MIETLLGSLLGTNKNNNASEQAEDGNASLLPLIMWGIIILGGLKLLSQKKEEDC